MKPFYSTISYLLYSNILALAMINQLFNFIYNIKHNPNRFILIETRNAGKQKQEHKFQIFDFTQNHHQDFGCDSKMI